MNDAQLRTALEIAQCGSMTAAAQELLLTQPAVKKQLDALEAELGFSLFERSAHGCVPTKAGKVFCEGMAGVLAHAQDVCDAALRASKEDSQLALCVLPGVVSPNFAQICRALVKRHPEVSVRYIPMPYVERPLAVAQHRADIGVYFDIPELLENLELEFWPSRRPQMQDAGLFCLMSPDNPFTSLDRLEPRDLVAASTPLAAFDAAPFAGMFDAVGIEGDAGVGVPPAEIRSISGDEFEVLAFCDAGGMYLCRYLVERYTSLVSMPLDWKLPPEGFITRRDPSYPTRLFLNAAAEVLGEHSD